MAMFFFFMCIVGSDMSAMPGYHVCMADYAGHGGASAVLIYGAASVAGMNAVRDRAHRRSFYTAAASDPCCSTSAGGLEGQEAIGSDEQVDTIASVATEDAAIDGPVGSDAMPGATVDCADEAMPIFEGTMHGYYLDYASFVY